MVLKKAQYTAVLFVAGLLFLIGSCLYVEPTCAKDSPIIEKMYTVGVNFNYDVSCKDIGMIPNDETRGLSNYNILINEAKKGSRISVDGTYYISSPYSDTVSENEVSHLYLTGESPAKGKIILNGGCFFNLKGNAVVENISIECPTERLTALINMTVPFTNEIMIRGNYITGNIRMVSSAIAVGYDYASTQTEIKKLTIEDNIFYDIYNIAGSRALVYAGDTPVKMAVIRNNTVTNFSYIFYYNGVTNGNRSADYLYENNNAVIEGNTVVCTDDYDAVSKNNGHAEVYYCFALIEGFSVECRGNTFEGFHISDSKDTVVYDNYLSVTQLLYENNLWKNNVNFTPGLVNVDIMKSKGAPSVVGARTERIYKNNTYIVEPSYADKFGEDRFLLRKEINTYVSNIDYILIEDNYFDVYILSFRLPRFTQYYKFNENTIIMDTTENSINWQMLVGVFDMKDNSDNFIPRNAIFTNNTITCDSKAFGNGVGHHPFFLIHNESTCGDKTVVDFSNNKINVPGNMFDRYSIDDTRSCSTVVNFNNNTISGYYTPFTKNVLRYKIGSSDYFVNILAQTMDTTPIIRDDRTLLPIRYVAIPLGASVGWNEKEQKATISINGRSIDLWIGKSVAMVDGIYVHIDKNNENVKPVVIPPGRIMLPLRFIAENLGCKVDWDPSKQMVTVTYPSDN